MDELTESRLAEIERRANAATPGPWRRNGEFGICTDDCGETDGGFSAGVAEVHDHWYAGIDCEPNADFITHARQDVPLLLDALKVAHEGIAVLMQDSDAYQRGKADGRRECAEALRGVANRVYEKIAGKTGKDRDFWEAVGNAYEAASNACREPELLPPPLPPDVVRRENARLRESLLGLIAGVEGSYVVSDFVRGKIDAARETLGVKGD